MGCISKENSSVEYPRTNVLSELVDTHGDSYDNRPREPRLIHWDDQEKG